MADPNATDVLLNTLSNLPIHPTGSGIADLTIAYEQMKLAEEADIADSSLNTATLIKAPANAEAITPMEVADVEESAAHPS